MRKFVVVLSVAGCLLSLPGSARAATITVSETLEDALGFDLFSRNLTRTRSGPAGTVTTAPGAENAISDTFGLWTGADIAWRHDFSWIPVGAQFLTAELEIRAFGVDGHNDSLRVNNQVVGTLTPEFFSGIGLIDTGFSVTTSSSSWLVSGLTGTRGVNLLIDPTGGFANPDNFSVYFSRLVVTYDDSRVTAAAAAVPEPASLLLLGSGVAAAVARRRREPRG